MHSVLALGTIVPPNSFPLRSRTISPSSISSPFSSPSGCCRIRREPRGSSSSSLNASWSSSSESTSPRSTRFWPSAFALVLVTIIRPTTPTSPSRSVASIPPSVSSNTVLFACALDISFSGRINGNSERGTLAAFDDTFGAEMLRSVPTAAEAGCASPATIAAPWLASPAETARDWRLAGCFLAVDTVDLMFFCFCAGAESRPAERWLGAGGEKSSLLSLLLASSYSLPSSSSSSSSASSSPSSSPSVSSPPCSWSLSCCRRLLTLRAGFPRTPSRSRAAGEVFASAAALAGSPILRPIATAAAATGAAPPRPRPALPRATGA
mmetsp:Transcript_13545/g.44599  ORF Transcript_13545/g.44599 Transcript_13545/m.44599 type:complete len:323 (+) Transcript_13545:893-1861(+)